MLQKIGVLVTRLQKIFPFFLSAVGLSIYTLQGYEYAHHLRTMLDEGAYLYKGLLFVRGQYTPFEPFGPWTNKMPLAFLLPGYIQELYGPSLSLARYTMILIGVLNIIGLALIAWRFYNVWAGVVTIWVFAFNTWLIKTWTLAISQGWTSVTLTWSLFFLLKRKSAWYVYIGVLLVTITIFIRQNMIIILPIVFVYVFWEYGKSIGWQSVFVSLFTILTGHWIWWPHILSIWAPWLPYKWTPFLDYWRVSSMNLHSPDFSKLKLSKYWIVIPVALRSHFPDALGIFASTIILFPFSKRNFHTIVHNRTSRAFLFLFILWWWLVLWHIWAAIFKNCAWCLSWYLSFFAGLGWLTLPAGWLFLQRTKRYFIFLALIIPFLGVLGYSARESFGRLFVDNSHFKYQLLTLYRFLWRFFMLKYLIQEPNLKTLSLYISVSFAILVAIIFVIIAIVVYYRTLSTNSSLFWSLMFLLLFLQTPLLGGRLYEYDCPSRDVLSYYENIGRILQQTFPPNSNLYWGATRYNALLIYIGADIRVYPQQLNGTFNYYNGRNTNRLARLGYWNNELRKQWLKQADIVVFLQQESMSSMPPSHFKSYRELIFPLYCTPSNQKELLHVFIQE